MTPPEVTHLSSRDNPLVKILRRLAQGKSRPAIDGPNLPRIWVEGDHLASAALARGWRAPMVVFAESFWPQARPEWLAAADKVVLLPDALMASVSGLTSPAPVAFVFDVPATPQMDATAPTVVLDRLQDAGNVGSILRSAAAFGFKQVLALPGCARLWSPKVLRAGMGAHFGLALLEGSAADLLDVLRVPLLATSSHEGGWLHQAVLPWPCAWVLGHEGQGVDAALMARCAQTVRIAQPGGEESLGVAAAAAICLHASAAQNQSGVS